MKFTAEYSIEKDIENHLDYGYEFKGMEKGRDNPREGLLASMEDEKANLLRSSKSREEAYSKIKSYLENPDKNNIDELNENAERLNAQWEYLGQNLIKFLEFIYQKPFPFDTIKAYLTTHRNYPYSYTDKYFYVPSKFVNPQMNTCLHELNHWMFYYYYPDLWEDIGEEKYDILKESLTFFTNPTRGWYPKEESLRILYASRIWSSMDEALQEGIKLLEKE